MNKGLQVLAWAFKFATVDDLLADVAKPTSANKALLQRVMKLHVVRQDVIVRAAVFPDDRTTWATGLPGVPVTVERSDGQGKFYYKLDNGVGEEDVAVRGPDLTFTGPYSDGASTYIVHAIDLPMLPPKTGLVVDDDGPCPRYDPDEDAGPAYLRISDCNTLLTAANVSVDGATVVSFL